MDIVRDLIHEFLSRSNSYWAKIITLFMWFVATHALNTRKVIGSGAPCHRFVSRIRSLNGAEGLKSSTFQDSFLNK